MIGIDEESGKSMFSVPLDDVWAYKHSSINKNFFFNLGGVSLQA